MSFARPHPDPDAVAKVSQMMWNANDLEDFLGEEVVDMEGNPAGTFACYWERDERNALLLGVEIPGRSGHIHIVPARGARFDERQSYVQLTFTRDKMVQAPCLACGCEMDDAFVRRIWEFYEGPTPSSVASAPDLENGKVGGSQLRRVVRGAPTKGSP